MAATEAKHELERRVADERASLSSLYTAARALETLDAERLYPAIALTARRFLQADACQCYVLEGELMRPARRRRTAPRAVGDPARRRALVGLAVRLGRPVSVRDATAIGSLDDLHGASLLMAAPLLGPQGTLLGCITVTSLPFLRLTPRRSIASAWSRTGARGCSRTRGPTRRPGRAPSRTTWWAPTRCAYCEAPAPRGRGARRPLRPPARGGRLPRPPLRGGGAGAPHRAGARALARVLSGRCATWTS